MISRAGTIGVAAVWDDPRVTDNEAVEAVLAAGWEQRFIDGAYSWHRGEEASPGYARREGLVAWARRWVEANG